MFWRGRAKISVILTRPHENRRNLLPSFCSWRGRAKNRLNLARPRRPIFSIFLFSSVFAQNDTHGVIREQLEFLESQIASAANAAEDLIESHKAVTTESDLVEDQIHSGSISAVDLQTVIEDMDSVTKKGMAFKDDSGSRDDMHPTYSMPTTNSSTPLITTDKNTMVGFDEQLTRLLDKLTGQRSNRQIIPIVGMGGIGKTTLAKNAYEHSLIVQHFDIRTWVTISQNQIDEQLLGEKLYKRLWSRRYLIVIDDIWSIEAWEEVSRFFPDNNNGSRIVVTTRISNVATHFDSSLFELSFLDEDQSWDLFCKKTFGEAGCPLELEDIGNEIVKKCKGLPLAICVIGGLLGRSHMTQKYWKNISKDLISILNSGEDENCSSILSLCYTYLPAHLKPCFLYMGIFPEDDEIRVSQLIKLWVAEGFIKLNQSQSLEEIARGYLNDLIDRNLILKQLGSTGRIKFCKIHDLLRDLSLKVAQKDEFICVMEDIQRGVERGRRIVCNEKNLQAKYQSQVLHTLQLPSLTRTLPRKKLRRHIVDQVNMRYLAYNKRTRFLVVKLPSSIDVLWNLQTIIIRKNKIKAPSEIWEMRQLRHVDIYELHLPDPPQSGDQQQHKFVLQNLQTLKNVVNFVWSEEACKRVINVRKLQIDVHNLLQKLTFPSSLKKLYLVGSKVHWKDLTIFLCNVS
ncbi:hypothetical protein MIMGU_mgv1a025687mg [Erythranthe guttata]|uniref:Uncharacterized protein n=1 Tax=Erythranthe guttata TaxID=4155 RepID=A0A022Q6F5_ERYGU|nr:hypothetical protein MIMGU_mgv1a025687mg [Erythranthe guttata]